MKVLIADDHGIVRSGLRMLLERQTDIDVIGEASDGAEARDMAIRDKPDLAILDVKMPKLTGLQATREIRAQAPTGIETASLTTRTSSRSYPVWVPSRSTELRRISPAPAASMRRAKSARRHPTFRS